MGLFAVIGPSRNEYRSGDASLRLRYFSTIPSRCHQASSSRSSAGKSGRLSTASMLSLITAMNLFSLEELRCAAILSDRQNARPQLRTGEPAVPPQLPTVAGDLFPARSTV